MTWQRSLRLLARHLPGRQDGRHARRRPDGVPGRCRQRAEAPRGRRDSRLTPATSFPPRSVRAPTTRATSTCSGTAATTRAASRSCGWTATRCRPISCKGTQTAIHLPGLLSFASVSIRGDDVYRVRPEQGLGLCRHTAGQEKPEVLCPAASDLPAGADARPCRLRRARRQAVRRAAGRRRSRTSFATAFGAPITAPVAVADGRIYVACEDGYLYVFGPDGKAPLPDEGPGSLEDPQPAHRAARRREIRLVHELRRLRRHQRQRAGPEAAAADALGPAAGRDGQAPAGLRRRPAVHAHGRRPDHRRRAGHRAGCCGGGTGPTCICRSPRRSMYDGKLLVPQAGMKRSLDALPRCRHRQAAVGSAVHRLAELEPAVPAGRAWQRRHLRLGLGRIRRRRGPRSRSRSRARRSRRRRRARS